MRAKCSFQDNSNCKEPMSFLWSLYDSDKEFITEDFFFAGNKDIQTAVEEKFFESHNMSFQVGLEATNADGFTGKIINVATSEELLNPGELTFLGTNKVFLKINQPPIGGECDILPKLGFALVDKFTLLCDGWTDPEDIGIFQYKITRMRPLLIHYRPTHIRPVVIIIFTRFVRWSVCPYFSKSSKTKQVFTAGRVWVGQGDH